MAIENREKENTIEEDVVSLMSQVINIISNQFIFGLT